MERGDGRSLAKQEGVGHQPHRGDVDIAFTALDIVDEAGGVFRA